MNYKERQYLKKKIEIDLELLAEESWQIDIQQKLYKILENLKDIYLEGYED